MIQLGLFYDEPETIPQGSRREAGEPDPAPRGGFAAMSRERHRAVSSEGGRAAAKSGNARRFTADEARIAGRKGGRARWGWGK